MSQELNADGMMRLVGAVIRQAILDYKGKSQPFPTYHEREDARNFLLSDRLEEFLQYFGVDYIVDADAIRVSLYKY